MHNFAVVWHPLAHGCQALPPCLRERLGEEPIIPHLHLWVSASEEEEVLGSEDVKVGSDGQGAQVSVALWWGLLLVLVMILW